MFLLERKRQIVVIINHCQFLTNYMTFMIPYIFYLGSENFLTNYTEQQSYLQNFNHLFLFTPLLTQNFPYFSKVELLIKQSIYCYLSFIFDIFRHFNRKIMWPVLKKTNHFYPSPLSTHEEVVNQPKIFLDTLKSLHSMLGTRFM